MEATVQMNVRIDPELKSAGDRVLELNGITPSQAVRTLYKNLTSDGDAAEQALRAVSEKTPSEEERRAEVERALQGIRDIHDAIRSLNERFGFKGYAEGERPTDKELLEQAIWEHYQEKGMVGA